MAIDELDILGREHHLFVHDEHDVFDDERLRALRCADFLARIAVLGGKCVNGVADNLSARGHDCLLLCVFACDLLGISGHLDHVEFGELIEESHDVPPYRKLLP